MSRVPYQYVVLRCVPRVDREEFVNVGVVLHSQSADFLDARGHVDAELALVAGDEVPAERLDGDLGGHCLAGEGAHDAADLPGRQGARH